MKDQYTSTYNNLLFAYSQTSDLSNQNNSHRSSLQIGLRVPDSFKYSSIKTSNLMLESVTMKIHKHSLMNFLSNNDLFTDDFYFFYSVVKDQRRPKPSYESAVLLNQADLPLQTF